MLVTRKLALKLVAALAVTCPAAAQTGVDITPPPAPAAPASPVALVTKFVSTAIPNTNYIATASRMASAYAGNSKLRKLAADIAKAQTSIATSLSAWVNVSGPVVTRRSPSSALGGLGNAKISAPGLLPAQVGNLQKLSTLRGSSFDSLYVSTLMESLTQLEILYREIALTDADPGLKEIAARELPKVVETISMLNEL